MDRWNRTAHVITHHAGSKHAFATTVALTVVWAVVGVVAGPGRGWELAVTCGVPILTLLMVIVLQHTQTRDTKAIQIKLNELLLALDGPDDRVVDAGQLGDKELQELHDTHRSRAPV